jgi:hypothetical protein
MVSTGNIIRLAIFAVVASSLLSIVDVTIGIGIVDQLIDVLDLTQYL